uniref:Uncharacterized protein n=1 Tax=Rhodopseudomonas palustris (strain DX-1) TaxID=652103 RepID=E6VL57_RHOPX
MTQLKLPEAWSLVMDRVRSVLPSAFIAGGALRDLDNGRPVKDIDVFFTDEMNWHEIDKALAGIYEYARECPGQYLDGAAAEVSGTTTYLSLTGFAPELNLIQLDQSFNPATIIDRVDFGICQIGADVMGVSVTEAYRHDKVNECFTLTRAETVEGVERSIKRYERLQQKYQGWPLYWKAEHADLVHQAYANIAMREDIGG